MEISEKCFGSVVQKKEKATGDHKPDLEILRAPVEGPESVIPLFCKGCGMHLEATKEQAKQFALIAETPLVLDGKHYFELSGCEECDGDRNEVVLKEI